MLDQTSLFIVLALVFSAFIKGSLGLGFSTICLAILVNIIELKTAISIVILPSLVSNLIVMFEAGKLQISLKIFWLMIVMTAPGMLLGLQLLRQTDNSMSIKLLAIVLFLYGCWGLRNRQFKIPNKLIPTLNPIIGFMTGVINGATGSQIFPVMPYLLSLNISKDILVQTINLSFTLSSLIMLISLSQLNALNTASILTYSLGILPVMLGVYIGGKVRNRLDQERFKKAVMILIVILGLLLLLS
jgi:uncharacterized membrane protein YfcA